MTDQPKKKPRKVEPFEKTFELRRPITLGKDAEAHTYTEIELREPTVKQLGIFVKKAQGGNELEALKYLMTLISSVPLPVLDDIGTSDFFKMQDYLLFFINPPEEDDPEGNVEGSQ